MDNSKSSSPQTRRKRRQGLRTSKKPRRLPPYNVILLNDDDHTYGYVIEMLGSLFGFDGTKAYQLADQLNPQGRVVLLTTTKEHAEFKQEQIHAFGPDRRVKECAGAMSCIIEPARS